MAQVQLAAMHWRDRAIAKSEIISDGWQVFLAWTGRGAEIVLFVCMAISLIEMIPSITLPDLFTGGVFVVQMITLDVAGFGLTSLAKAVKRAGDEETAQKAATVGTLLIAIMVISMLSGGIDRLFGAKIPAVKEWMLYVDDFLILVRVGMTVFYGKIMHSLRDSQQHMQAQTDTRIADLEADLNKARTEQRRLEKALNDEKESAKKQHAENERLAQQLADVQQSLRDALQNGTDVQASMHKAIREKNENDSQIQQLKADLQSAQDTIARLRLTEQQSNGLSETVKKQREEIENLTVKVSQAERKCESLQAKFHSESEKKKTVKASETEPGNITSIDQARVKARANDAEILAYMETHSEARVPDVAAHFGVTTRTIYNVLKRQQDCESEAVVQ